MLKIILYILLVIYLFIVAYNIYFFLNLEKLVKNCHLVDDITLYSLLTECYGKEEIDEELSKKEISWLVTLVPFFNIAPLLISYVTHNVPAEETDKFVDLIKLKIKQSKEEYDLKKKLEEDE